MKTAPYLTSILSGSCLCPEAADNQKKAAAAPYLTSILSRSCLCPEAPDNQKKQRPRLYSAAGLFCKF